MSGPAQDMMAGGPGGSAPTKEANPETTLGSAYSPVDYMSITSFPRLPEDEMMAADNTAKMRSRDDDNVLSEQDTDPDLFLKTARLRRLPSSASDLAGSTDLASLRETTADPFAEGCACQRDGLTVIVTACLTFATAVTVALIMQIYFGEPQVLDQGAVVSDAARCTAVGRDILARLGSSVDAAVAVALCLGVVHPHTSGLGGGGVMLVHNSRKNETRVIDFRETAPAGLQEELLNTDLDLNPGLLVAVPGMLSGLHQAHLLYGRLPWKDVVSVAADVAREGFNITHDLAEALAKVKDGNVSASFREVFLPGGQAPPPGLLTRRPDLAAVLDAVAHQGISAFYSGNLTREMAAAVQASGGVLQEEDFANYSSILLQPAEVTYQGHHVMAAPAPHAGVGLLAALNILEGFNISRHTSRNSTYHWVAEAVKIALGLASELGDPLYQPSVTDIVSKMLSKSEATALRQMINDTQAFPADHYTATFSLQSGATAAQVMVMGPDDIIVSIMSSLNRPFGSGIVTPSGVLLNSQILDFSWPNKTENVSPNPHNSIQRGKRPMSFLMPTAVRPALGVCGTYLGVGSSNADRALSGITQVLMNILSLRINMSDSLAFGRLHPQLQPDTLLVDAEFLEEDVELLQARGHRVERLELLSVVDGTRRTNDLITGTKDPRSVDASALILARTP